MYTALNKDYEDELVQYALQMQKMFFGLTPRELGHLAFDITVKYNISNRFTKVKKQAGPDWMVGFLRRLRELSVRNLKQPA